jgi:hypothetical protein
MLPYAENLLADFALAAGNCGVVELPANFPRLSLAERSAAGGRLRMELRERAERDDVAAREFLASPWGEPLLAPTEIRRAIQHDVARIVSLMIESLPACPNDFRGRGIVTCAGGQVYQTCAWVLFSLLRRFGCELPIECWRTGPFERDAAWERLVADRFGVTCIDAAARGYIGHPFAPPLSFRDFSYAPGALHGYALKPFAIMHSAFREVLFLDADNTPERAPTFLFDSPEYLATGALFWSDLPDCRLGPELTAFGLEESSHVENWESGQMLLDKERCWRALALANWFNTQAAHFYRHSWGDCGTWQAAWKWLSAPWSMPGTPARRAGDVALVQHDISGDPLFFHRVGRRGKWRLDPFEPTPGFPHNAACRAALEDLVTRRTNATI